MTTALSRLIWIGFLTLALAPLTGGCVRRTVTIRTDPQGARITLNDEEIGSSPATTDFVWYGDYEVIVRKPGYATLQTHQRIDAPWYQWPAIDLLTEALLPIDFHDQHEFAYNLQPASQPARDDLIRQAQDLRERTLYKE